VRVKVKCVDGRKDVGGSKMSGGGGRSLASREPVRLCDGRTTVLVDALVGEG
jgi:hypothetical protein